jgi:hypothetical protein
MILDDIAFRGLLNKGEHVQYVAHVHPFTIYPRLFRVLLFGILCPALGYYLFPPFLWIFLAWALCGTLLFVYRVAQWYLDAWIITNFAVIDQEWNSFFDRATVRIEYGNIEGISNEVKGFWGTVMRYGNIQIEHMSGEPVVLANVSAPRKVERFIISQQQNYVRKQNFEDHGKLKDLLTNLLRSGSKNA